MSREAYQVPSLGGQNAFGGGAGAGGAADGFAGSVDGPVVAYLCGECNSRVSLKRGDQIRCKECGHRVLYKERTKRFVSPSLSLSLSLSLSFLFPSFCFLFSGLCGLAGWFC